MQVSRKHSYRGMRVSVVLRDGTMIAGTLLAWGTRVIRVQTAAGWVEHSSIGVEVVAR